MGTESVSYDYESGPRRGRLYFSAFTANLVYFSCGCSLSWTSPTLPKLTAPDSWLPITEAEGSWIGSLLMLGGSIGPFLAIPFLNRFGRKRTIQGNTFLYIIGWAVVGFATSLRGIFLGRFLQGIAVGVYFTSVPMYLGEIAEKNVRAALVSCCEVSVSCGYLVEYGVGPNVSYKTLALVSSCIPLLTFILFFWIPESPYYLLSRGRKMAALKSLCWLRSSTSLSAANEELTQIQSALSEAAVRESSLKELFSNRGNIRAMYLASGLLFFQQFSGINVVLFYAQPIFMKSGASFSSSASALIVGIVQTTSASFTPLTVKHIGFKIPLLVSAGGMAIAQGVLGLYFYMDLKAYDMSSFGFVPVSCLVLYILVYCLGYGPVPWAVVGEFFAPNIKSLASAICTSLSFFLAFLLTKFFSNLSEMIGTYAAFWLFSVWCAVAFLFTITLVPNTKGMSLMEIQSLLHDTGSSTGISVPPPISRRNYTQIPQE